jgi:hypothetical protein
MQRTTDIRPAKRRTAAIAASGVLAIAALTAPSAAVAAPADGTNSIWAPGGAMLYEADTLARFSVIYKCAAGTEADINVKLVQSETQHGESTDTVTCLGKPNVLTVEVPSFGAPWQLGHATAYVDISENTGDPTKPHTIKVVEAIDFP